MKTIAVILAALTFTGAAGAHVRHHHHHRHHPRHHRHRVTRPASPTSLAPPALIGIGDVPGCMEGADPTPYLQEYHAQILRIIINPDRGANGSALPCIQTAVSEGYKVNLSIQWWTGWTAGRVADFYRQVLPQYAPYVWAVSIGNEQELQQHGPGEGGQSYADNWKAAEPIVAQLAPNAIRVAGEISPWGLPFLEQALLYGLPGVQAIAAHPYAMTGCFSLASITALSRAAHLPLWFTEALSGPNSWGPDLPLTQMAGAAVADAWLDVPTPSAPPPPPPQPGVST